MEENNTTKFIKEQAQPLEISFKTKSGEPVRTPKGIITPMFIQNRRPNTEYIVRNLEPNVLVVMNNSFSDLDEYEWTTYPVNMFNSEPQDKILIYLDNKYCGEMQIKPNSILKISCLYNIFNGKDEGIMLKNI